MYQGEELKRDERWELASKSAGEGIWDWDLVTNKVYRSDIWFELFGYAPGELPDSPWSWEHLVHPDDLAYVLSCRRNHIEGLAGNYSVEHRMRCKDGEYRWFLSRGRVVRDEQGKAVRMLGFYSNIEETIRAREQLKRQNEALRLLHATSLQAIGTEDYDGTFARILKAAYDHMKADWGCFGVVDDKEAVMNLHSTVGLTQTYSGSIRPGESILGKAWEQAAVVMVPDYSQWTGRYQKFCEPIQSALAVPVLLNGTVVAVFALCFTAQRDFSEQENYVLDQFALIYAQVIQKQQMEHQLQTEHHRLTYSETSLKQVRLANFLSSLVQGQLPGKAELALQAAEFGLKAEAGYRVLVAEAGSMDLTESKQENLLQEELCACIWKHETYQVLLIPAAEEENDRHEWTSRAKELRQRLMRTEDGGHFGISLYCRSLADIGIGFKQARDALEFGRRMQQESPIHHTMDIGLVPILSRVGDKEQVEAFISQTIGKLVEYDSQKATQLLDTLIAILHGQSLRSVAAGLFIHPKTLLFRKHRIEQLLGVSLDDGGVRMNLSLAVQLYGLR